MADKELKSIQFPGLDDRYVVPEGGGGGAPGPAGKDGITPTIGENGNWYLGDIDTQKPSRGEKGADGAAGKDGSNGHTPVITAEKSGKVTTIKADGVTIATVNDGTDGTNGTDGAPGAKGDTGATPDIQIGTVTTLDAGADATASMSGTAENPMLNLGIPQGTPGDDYVLTDADKTEIAAEIIAGGVEAELGDESLPAPASAAVRQIVKIKAVDENGKITETEAVDMPSGGGSPSSALICDITLAEAAQAVSQTLEHNFYALHCIVNCGTSGVALLVDADGASVSGKINLMLDTTVASYNIRKYGMINYNAAAWKSYAIHAIWSPDRTFFEQSQNEELSTGENATVYHSFGGVTAMKGTLGADALSPDSGRTVNIVAGANTLLNAGVRVIIWGEYYE